MGDKTMAWNPATGEAGVYDKDAVPEGFLDHHPNDPEKGTAPAAAADDVSKDPPLDRAELLDALKEGGVEHNPNATDRQLDAALKGALRKVLTARKIEYTKNDSTRQLLALVKGA